MPYDLPVIANTYRCAINWTHGSGQKASNVMHFRAPTLDAVGVANAIDSNVTTNMWNNVLAAATVTSLYVTKLDGVAASYIKTTSGAKWSGTAGASDWAPNVASIVSFRTAKRGQRNRGRIYLPFQAETNTTAGVLPAGVAANQTAWNTFLTAMATATCSLVVASYGRSEYIKNHQLVTAVWTPEANDVTSIVVETTLGTQRRRQSRLR